MSVATLNGWTIYDYGFGVKKVRSRHNAAAVDKLIDYYSRGSVGREKTRQPREMKPIILAVHSETPSGRRTDKRLGTV